MRHAARKKRAPSDLQLDLRAFLGRGKRWLDAEAGDVVSEVYLFGEAVSANGFNNSVKGLIGVPIRSLPLTKVVAAVAEHLTRKGSGTESNILRKAIQETLFDAAGLGNDPDELDLQAGLEKFLKKHGTNRFLELFLSRYVFSAIWIRIQETLRAHSGSESLPKLMARVERVCRSAVKATLEEWRSAGKLEAWGAKKTTGANLIKAIETRLSHEEFRWLQGHARLH